MNRPEGFSALPKRFRDYVESLERERDAALAKRPVKQKTSIKIQNYLARHDGFEEAYLPDGTKVEFTVAGENFIVGATDVGVEIRTEIGMIAVVPDYANVVAIVGRKEIR